MTIRFDTFTIASYAINQINWKLIETLENFASKKEQEKRNKFYFQQFVKY